MCQWTRVRRGTWPSCLLLVTSSSTPSWQRMMKWSSCMSTSPEVSPHRNLTCWLLYNRAKVFLSRQYFFYYHQCSHASEFSLCDILCVCVFCFFLQIQDLVPFMYQMTGALCTPSHWSATFTPPQGVRQTSLTSPPCEEFSSPASWQKVSIHVPVLR